MVKGVNVEITMISLIATILIMVIGLLINHYWYQKHDKNLFRFIVDMLCFNGDFLITIVVVCLLTIILLVPFLNIIVALSINIGLFIRGVE